MGREEQSAFREADLQPVIIHITISQAGDTGMYLGRYSVDDLPGLQEK